MKEIEAENAMNIIVYAGTAKSMVMEALSKLADDGDIGAAEETIAAAGKELGKAHDIQTGLLVEESQSEESQPMSILMIHAQDHFMNAVTMRDMATIFLKMYQEKQ